MLVSLIQSFKNPNGTKTGLPSNSSAKKVVQAFELEPDSSLGLQLASLSADLGLTKPP